MTREKSCFTGKINALLIFCCSEASLLVVNPCFQFYVQTLTTASLVGSIGTVFVSVALQGLWEALTRVPAWEVSEEAAGLQFYPVGLQR